ncbi:MAG: ThiF family adenylyltransferase [Anaerolineae bacterium]|nr:ThiF family adenylyltransferase [Anaerolineae bacterium]
MMTHDSAVAGRQRLVLVGVGTLGSAVLEILCRTLLERPLPPGTLFTITLVDDDVLEPHNIAKSAIYLPSDVGCKKVHAALYWTRRLGIDIDVEPIGCPIQETGAGLFLDAAAVICAVDNYAARMSVNRSAWRAGVPYLFVGGLQGGESRSGRYQLFMPGEDQPCVECGWGTEEYALLEQSFSCTRRHQRGPRTGLAAAIRIASLIVDEALGALTGASELEPGEVRFDPSTGCRRLSLPHNPDCNFDHARWENIVWMEDPGQACSLADTLALAESHLNGPVGTLYLNRPVSTGFTCSQGHNWPEIARVGPDLPPTLCPVCGMDGFATEVGWRLPRQVVLSTPVPLQKIVPDSGVVACEAADAAQTIHIACRYSKEGINENSR